MDGTVTISGRRRLRSVGGRTATWLVGSAVGATIIALPDTDDRVFSLSRTHGPSGVDLVGVAVLLLGWAPVAALLWSSRRRLAGGPGRLAATLALVGVAWLVATVAADVAGLWLVGVALLTAAQLVALGRLWSADRDDRRPRM
ncbi:MAG TPA: hypothetical protein VFG72_17050 [Marmoricola sp.]|nr:hypothetical protein [Marmoricola sp.]